MTWRTLVINEHSKLSYQNNSMIYKSDNIVEKIHISEIHTVMLETTDILISTALISKLTENKVRVIFCDGKHDPIGEINPYYGSYDTSKKINQQIVWDGELKKKIWTEIIRQKIENQRILLGNLGYASEEIKLNEYLQELMPFDSTNREGHAAKVYFNALFGMDFNREKECDINAYLNYGYTLLLSTFNREIVKNGHLTQLGLKHSNYFNPYNLSCDFMEPFRVLVDQSVVSIYKKDFSKNKHSLFQIFNERYEYKGSRMYLTNIIEHYVKKIITTLDEKRNENIPEFKINEL